jgi:pyrimidine-nucleoside phosphorylase
MSKKLAAGTQSIVLDVKCGSGAFMQTPEAARELAEAMVRIGKAHGRRTAAVITNMDVPLGRGVGNVLEVKEAIEVLRGEGPADLKEVCLTLASKMVSLSLGLSDDEAMARVTEALNSGAAYKKFCEWIGRQGGNGNFASDPSLFGSAKFTRGIYSEQDGYIYSVNAEKIGTAAMMLGAGRENKDSVINYNAGIVLCAKTGERVKKGDLIAVLHADDENLFSRAESVVRDALTFSEAEPPAAPLVYEIIS